MAPNIFDPIARQLITFALRQMDTDSLDSLMPSFPTPTGYIP
jgi:hypothetical protein